MQITAVIIDDELNNIDNLAFLLQKNCPQVTIVGTAENAAEGKKIILQKRPTMVFLDIQMPGKNGFELLKSLNKYSFEVIFVTGFEQYGIQAIKCSAIDYLLKPVNPAALKRAVDKAVQQSALKEQGLRLDNLLQSLQEQNREKHRLVLSTLKRTRSVQISNIIRCESINTYTTFFLASEEKIMVSNGIYEYEELLNDYGFIRCHQSHLVNKDYIKTWVRGYASYLTLEDGTEIPVSRGKKKMIKQQLKRII